MSVSFWPFFDLVKAQTKRPEPFGASERAGGCGEKVAQKRSQGFGMVGARNFMRGAHPVAGALRARLACSPP
jgi:hypothetical protein